MPELGPYGSVRGARGNSRPYRESRRDPVKPTRMTDSGHRRQFRNTAMHHGIGPHFATRKSML